MCSPARAYLIRCMTAFIWFHLNHTGTTFMCSFASGGSVTWAARVGEAAWYCLRSAGPETGETGEMCRSTRWSPAGEQVFLHRLAAPVRDYERRESCTAPVHSACLCENLKWKWNCLPEPEFLILRAVFRRECYYKHMKWCEFSDEDDKKGWTLQNVLYNWDYFHLGWLSGTGVNRINFRHSKHIILLRQKDKCMEFPQSSH